MLLANVCSPATPKTYKCNNACDWSKTDHVTLGAGKIRHLLTVCLTKVHTIGWNPNGIPTRSMENVKWHNPSQVLTAKHVSYPQLTATALFLK